MGWTFIGSRFLRDWPVEAFATGSKAVFPSIECAAGAWSARDPPSCRDINPEVVGVHVASFPGGRAPVLGRLRLAISLARSSRGERQTSAALGELARIYGELTDGSTIADLQVARMLLIDRCRKARSDLVWPHLGARMGRRLCTRCGRRRCAGRVVGRHQIHDMGKVRFGIMMRETSDRVAMKDQGCSAGNAGAAGRSFARC